MFSVKISSLGVLWLFCWMVSKTSACSITLSYDIPGTSPVYMYRPLYFTQFQPLIPTSYNIPLPAGSELLVSCVDRSFTTINAATLLLYCTSRNTFEIYPSRQQIDLVSLNCTYNPRASIKPYPNDKCANNAGTLHQAGFNVPGFDIPDIGFSVPGSFLPVYSICYDPTTKTHFYSKNEINGAAIGYAIAERSNYFFSDGITDATNAYFDRYYGLQNEIRTCIAHYGPTQNYVTDRSNRLDRGHFTPNADFIFPFERVATFFYMNVGPQPSSVNTGNWRRVETIIRRIAQAYQDTFTIYTGGFGTLSFEHKTSNVNLDFFLDCVEKKMIRGNRSFSAFIKAPLFFFKVVHYEKQNTAIVFMTSNNVHAAPPIPCQDICSETGFARPEFFNITAGYTFCCDINEFNAKYPFLPSNLLGTPTKLRNPFAQAYNAG